LLLLALSLAPGQRLGARTYLPDSLDRSAHPQCLAYGSANNIVYAGDADIGCVFAIDGLTNEKVARIRVVSPVKALCYSAQNNKVYCANGRYLTDSTVTVIDCATNSVLATVPAGSSPCALCYSPANNKVYCANAGSGSVTVIDCATDSVLATVTAGDYPRALCYNPNNNKVYCANQSDNTVTVIDGATNSVIATVAVGEDPSALCYNPNSNKIYCADANSYGGVFVIDGASNQVLATVKTGEWPHALCYNPVDNKVYSANFYSASVTAIDGATNSVLATVTVGESPDALCYDPQNNKVYCANRSGSVTVIDGATNSVLATVAAGTYACALCCNPLNNKVYCANYWDASVTVIDGASNVVHEEVAQAVGAELAVAPIREAEQLRQEKAGKDEEQRREQTREAARSRDVVISFGMTDSTLEALVGEPTYKSDRQEDGGAYRLLVWEYADKTFLRCLCEYSHVTGTYNLLAISGLSKPEDERKVLADGLATIVGYWPGDERTDGKYPETATGKFKRTNRRWYCEYYFQGQRLWNEF
jgi:YVTN family beta-propeller protein